MNFFYLLNLVILFILILYIRVIGDDLVYYLLFHFSIAFVVASEVSIGREANPELRPGWVGILRKLWKGED